MSTPGTRCGATSAIPLRKPPAVLGELPIIELPEPANIGRIPNPSEVNRGADAVADAVTPSPRLPRWLKRNVPKGNANHFTARLLEELRLETVCDNARCPNRMECYSQKTA